MVVLNDNNFCRLPKPSNGKDEDDLWINWCLFRVFGEYFGLFRSFGIAPRSSPRSIDQVRQYLCTLTLHTLKFLRGMTLFLLFSAAHAFFLVLHPHIVILASLCNNNSIS